MFKRQAFELNVSCVLSALRAAEQNLYRYGGSSQKVEDRNTNKHDTSTRVHLNTVFLVIHQHRAMALCSTCL